MTNWPATWLLIVITWLSVRLGKLLFGRLFNPLSIYSAVWGVCLVNYELHLIQYYEISTTAWIYILAAWVSLFLGAGIVLLLGRDNKRLITAAPFPTVDPRRLKRVILTLSVIAGIGLLSQLVAISREFGNPFLALLSNAGDIYRARISNELSGLGYIGSFAYGACPLAGIYTRRVGRITWVAATPLILVVFGLLFAMGRTGLGVAAVLFGAAFVYAPKASRFSVPLWQRILAISLCVMLVFTFFVVSAIRHLDVSFAGITPQMEKVSEYVPFFPSLYSNFSATPVAFSLYLETPEQDKVGFLGMYAFAPGFRILSRLGFRCAVPAHEENYYTPVPMNTGTYLKNIYSDFGVAGIIIFPFVLGLIVAGLIVRADGMLGNLGLVFLANLFVLVVFAFAFNFMLLGDWYIGLITGGVGAMVTDTGLRASKATLAQ